MRRPQPWRLGLFLCALALAGCAGAYHEPLIELPARFDHAGSPPAEGVLRADWWRDLEDDGLNAFLARVIANNRDLAQAGVRVRSAQARARLAGRDQRPTLSGDLSGMRSGPNSTYTATLALTFNPDPWRRLAATTAAAGLEAEATGEDLGAARLALIVTACDLYWDLAFTHQEIATGTATLADQHHILELVTAQRTFGLVSTVEVAEAEAAIAIQETALLALEQHLVEDRAALKILTGNAPGPPAADEPQALLARAIPKAPAGLPAEVLARRPDLRAAEKRLRSTWETGNAVRASMYPDFVLTGAGGAASTTLEHLFDHPVGSLLGAIALPFLDYPRHKLNNAITANDYQLAELGFRTAVYRALSEVDNALADRASLDAQRVALEAGRAAAAKAESLYRVRYRSGSVALRVWLEAQQNLRAAELALDNNHLAALESLAALCAALGSGADAAPM